MKIWLDDVRAPPETDWTWCRSFQEFEDTLRHCMAMHQVPEVISFDHDLGDPKHDGYDAIKLCAALPAVYPLVVRVHSANPVGAENIEKYDDWIRRYWPQS